METADVGDLPVKLKALCALVMTEATG